MADSCDANKDNSGTSEPEVTEQDDDQKPMLPKQESIVLYTQAALSGGKMAKGTGRMGRRPRPLLLKQISETPSSSSSQRRLLLKQQSETNQGIYNAGKKFQLTHQDTPNIIISGDCDFYLSDEEDAQKHLSQFFLLFHPNTIRMKKIMLTQKTTHNYHLSWE